MDEVLIFVVFAGCVAAVLGILWWLASRVRRRGIGGEVMGSFEEMWHPAAHRFRAEVRVQETPDGADATAGRQTQWARRQRR
ncbi:hypothetical protein [Micromonospora arida]|uniref:hypothetical protein n=1 Tax=Micromonospora arida TaxID=2203715 RepID=UPI0033B89F73